MLRKLDPDLLPVLAERLAALADPLRLQLMQALCDGEKSVGELVDLVGTSQPNVSRHLDRLERAGWITRRRDGNHVYIQWADSVSSRLCECLCDMVGDEADRLVRLAAALRGEEAGGTAAGGSVAV